MAIISENDCINCLLNEINYLNDFNKYYSKLLEVYFMGDDKKYLKNLGARFTYTKISNLNKLFSTSIPYQTPLIFLIAPDNSIFELHKVERGVDIKSQLFYSKIFRLFQNLYYKK